MDEHVLASTCGDGGEFRCASYEECRASAADRTYYEGQLSHVGEHYDLSDGDAPLRIVVVGQEYGHPPARVGLPGRRQMILTGFGRGRSYYAGDGLPARNPHMRGTTTALRLLTGGPLGPDRAGELLDLASGERVHLFDAFALVNVLLCSAVRPDTTTGRSSAAMRRNCLRHFVATLRILQPTVIVLQGRDVARWTAGLFEPVERVTANVERVRYPGGEGYLCTFTHPSAHGTNRWGDRLDALYIRRELVPALGAVRRLMNPQ
jgi:hypothetical protein